MQFNWAPKTLPFPLTQDTLKFDYVFCLVVVMPFQWFLPSFVGPGYLIAFKEVIPKLDQEAPAWM